MSVPSISVGQLLGNYRILEKIGGGGQGEVFRARDERFKRDVALKILPAKGLTDEEARDQFRQEAHAVGKLSHPNIATAFYFGEENGVDFLVTEYISGTGLDVKIVQGPLPEDTILALGVQFASGLEAAHREGIIHRDLKPGNLRITDDGQLKILDFGLAELVDPMIDVASAETVTLTMTLTGTLPYMAPEQFEGISDQRSDLWSAGVVLYEMATAQRPFPESQLQRLKDAILHKEPVAPRAQNPAISQGLETVILRALQKDPKRRYQTAKELRDDLARLAAGREVKHNTWLQRNSSKLALAAVLIAVLAYVTYRFWPQSPSSATNNYHVLAVLPIDTGIQDPAENAFGRGVAETVSARIAQGSNGRTFQLIPPNELNAQGVKTADAARHEFGADLVLAIGLQRSGQSMIRITCSLVDPRTHQQIDARTVTGEVNDLFTLEDTAVTEIFGMLPMEARSEQPPPSEVHAAVPGSYEYYVRGRGYLQDYQKPANIDSAIAEFDHALRLSPNYAPAYAGLGEAYWQGYKANRGKEWLDKARVNCEKALSADPKLAEGHTCLGNLFNDTGRYNEAVEEFQRALAAERDNADALNGLAEAYDKMGNSSAADETYKKAIALRPQYWAVYNWLGYFYFGHARYADAAAMFQKVINLTPNNQRGYNNLGAIQLMQGRYDEAIATFRKATELAPSRDTYGNLGAAYFYLRQYPKAVDAFNLAIKQDDQDAATWGYLGDALYWSPDRRNDAAQAYQKGVELARAKLLVNPKSAKDDSLVAEFSAMLDQKQPALDALQKALSLDPKDPEIMFKAALVYNHFGDTSQTLLWLRKAIALGYPRIIVRDTPDFLKLQNDSAYRALIAGT